MITQRCKYISNNLLQCKNFRVFNSSNKTISNVITDSSEYFCEQHDSHIAAVRAQAKKTRSLLDPGLRKDYEEDDFDLLRDMAPHIYEPCCSDSFMRSDENPLRNAGVMTDKEVARQYDAALSRTLEKLRDMRVLVLEKYKEHLKTKPQCKREQKKYKLIVRNRKERGMMERLRKDQSYAISKSSLTPYVEKVYRKHILETNGPIVRPSDYLKDPILENEEFKCEKIIISVLEPRPEASYESPPLQDNFLIEDIVECVLNSVVDCVEKRFGGVVQDKCKNLRIPMTDYCKKHVCHDPDQKAFVACRKCGAPCLSFNGSLCNLHAASRIPISPVRPSCVAVPPKLQMSNGKHPPSIVNGHKNVLKPVAECSSISAKNETVKKEDTHPLHENGDLKFPESSLIQLSSRKFIPTNGRRLVKDAFALPDSVYTVEQKKLKLSDDCTVIDDDLSAVEFENQFKRGDQKTKPNGNHMFSNGNIVFQPVRTVNQRPLLNTRGRSNVPATIQTINHNRSRIYDSPVNLQTTCARTRPFCSSAEMNRLTTESLLNDPSRRIVNRPTPKNLTMRAPVIRQARTLQYAHSTMPVNGSYCISQSPVSNIARQNTTFPSVVRNKSTNNIQPITYVKNGSKTVPVHALSR